MKSIKRLVATLSIAMLSLFSNPSTVLAAQTAWLVPFDNASATWDSSTGGSNYANVDDSLFCDGTTSYNHTSTTNEVDWYQISLSTIPNGSTVNKIEIQPCTSANFGTASSTINIKWRWNGGTSSGSHAVSNWSGSTPMEHSSPQTWSGLSLSKSSGSKLDIGVEYASGSVGARVSRMRAKIHY